MIWKNVNAALFKSYRPKTSEPGVHIVIREDGYPISRPDDEVEKLALAL